MNHTITPTLYPNHKPNTHKIYNTIDDDGREAWTIEFLDNSNNLRPAKGGKIYKHRQNAQRDCTALNYPIKHALKKAARKYDLPMCQAYHDGYTATVSQEEPNLETSTSLDPVYRLNLQLGGMPPYYSKTFSTIGAVEEAMKMTTFPVTVTWEVVEQEEI